MKYFIQYYWGLVKIGGLMFALCELAGFHRGILRVPEHDDPLDGDRAYRCLCGAYLMYKEKK